MKQLAEILKLFVESEPVTFGGPERATPTGADTDRLILRLERQTAINNRIITTIVASYVFLLLISSVLVILHHTDLAWVGSFLGGNFLALTGIGAKLFEMWRVKNYIDMMLALLPSLTPQEALKMIQTFYFEKLQGGSPK